MLFEATLLGMDRARSDPLAPPWPDLVISAGRLNENIAKWIRGRSAGRTRIVLVGRGWTPPGTVDLVVATPQYRLKPHPNLLINELPLHILDYRERKEAAARWAPRWAGLPRPWIAVLVGGSSGPYLFDAGSAGKLGTEASAVARAVGGSLLITTSSRTRPSVVPALRGALDAPAFLHEWRRGQEDNPYQALLASADRFIVTGDSMSMLAEAAGTGKPLQIFEFGSGLVPMHGPWSTRLEPGAWGRWLRLLRQRPRAILNWLAIALPPVRVNRARDIRIVQDILIHSGRAVWLGEDIARIRPAPLQDLERATRRVRALFHQTGAEGGATPEPVPTVRKAMTGAV
jgi:hypothetical protein